ncbi:App1 family protein [Psychroflexus sp. CAK57W]|uniref:phosphatase domain-containing protein n=1 Tax=Psychroflexus curvus TaxID=2873595 RepID=UPI001CCBDBAA|nr:App1 family protein [Psychroflexus curvus]MBZ9785968.1 App1 family protein [Psychroflexus curvus]
MAFLWHFTAVELKDKVLVTGTVLKNETSIDKSPRSILANAWNVLSSYRKKTYKRKSIRIETQSETFTIKTDKKGYFFEILPIGDLYDFKIYDKEQNLLSIDQIHPYHFQKHSTPIEVISDIDDTVIHSHTASALKRIFTILFKRPKRRNKVLFSNALLDYFDENKFRIAYLSKSESNLFGLITAIFRFNEIPMGPLFLTPYIRFKSLFKPKKGKHKIDFLHQLITNLPDKKFILMGDDTQKDMDIYTAIVNTYKSQIIKVFIRQTTFTVNEIQKEKWDTLSDTGVPCMYFQDDDDINNEILQLSELLNLQ